MPGEGSQASGKIPKREKAQPVWEKDVKELERRMDQSEWGAGGKEETMETGKSWIA